MSTDTGDADIVRKFSVDGEFRPPPESEFGLTRSYAIHNCLLSGKVIWPGQQAWKKTYFQRDGLKTDFVFWVCKEEMLFAMIKGRKL